MGVLMNSTPVLGIWANEAESNILADVVAVEAYMRGQLKPSEYQPGLFGLRTAGAQVLICVDPALCEPRSVRTVG